MSRPATRQPWPLLLGYTLLVAVTQLVWLSYAPVTVQAAVHYGTSEELIGDLAVLQPLVFVLLAVPSGRWTDRALRGTVSAGAVATAGGAVLRAAGSGSLGWALAGQLLAAIGQPLVLAATTALAARCFAERHRAAAIAVATAGQFVGLLAAALGGGPLVERGGIALLLRVHAVIALLAAAAVVALLARVRPAPGDPEGSSGALRQLLADPLLRRLAALLLIGVGVFNALATWLDPVMAALGRPGAAGALVGITTVAGIAGAAVLAPRTTTAGRRRALLLTATAATAVLVPLVGVLPAAPLPEILLAGEGLVLLACLPLALEWSERHTGPRLAGRTGALLISAGNLGGVLLVLLVQPFVGHPRLALLVTGLCALPGLALALTLPRTDRRPAEIGT